MIELIQFFNKWTGEITLLFSSIVTVYIFVNRAVSKVKPYTQVVDDIKILNGKIDNISSEFKNNHGSSLKDQICNIEKAVERNTQMTKSIFTRQRWILDNRSEPIFEADKKGNFTWVNESFTRLTKRSPNDLLGNKWRNIIEEEKREETFFNWESAIEQNRNFEQTIYLIDKKGNRFSAKCVASIQEDGEYIGSLTEIHQIR